MQSAPDKLILIAPPRLAVGHTGVGSALSSSSSSGEVSPSAGRSVIRRPDRLKLHPALQKLGWTGLADELNYAARVKEQTLCDPVLITENGTLLAGFGRWRLALLELRDKISCIEYTLDDNESLQFILA